MKTGRPYLNKRTKKFFLILSIILSFQGCGKLDAFEIETPEERVKHQIEMIDRLRGRLQVSDVALHSDYFSVKFSSDEVFEFFNEGTPIFSVSNKGTWIVNGTETRISANYSIFPEVAISAGNSWLLDGTDTGVPVYEKLNPEDVVLTVISHIFFVDNYIIAVLRDGTMIKSPVVEDSFYHVPNYWLSTLVEKEESADAVIAASEGNCASFVFFTDSHWGKNVKHSPALIRHIIDYTSISDVLFGGDVVTTHSTDLDTPMETGKAFQSAFGFLGTNFHCVYGNHDNNSDSQQDKTEYHLSEEQVFSWLQSQMTDVAFGDHYNFYYDNALTKTRIIGLDTGRYYYAQFRDKLPDTVRFIVETLSSVPEGWHVIIASHIWCRARQLPDGSWSYNLENYINPILKVFDDFNNRIPGLYLYNNQEVQYDFSEAGGHIEFCIGGHIHNNYLTYSDGGIPVVSIISDYFVSPEKGTTQEQSVSMVITDYKNRRLELFVVGRGTDQSINL